MLRGPVFSEKLKKLKIVGEFFTKIFRKQHENFQKPQKNG